MKLSDTVLKMGSLKFVKREKPAEIYGDNEHYMVELDSFYQRFGPICN